MDGIANQQRIFINFNVKTLLNLIKNSVSLVSVFSMYLSRTSSLSVVDIFKNIMQPIEKD